MAGSLAWASCYPVDVIKTRYQKDGEYKEGRFYYKYRGYVHCIRQSLAEDGLAVLYRGLVLQVCRAFISGAAIFAVQTWLMENLRPGESADEFKSALEKSAAFALQE